MIKFLARRLSFGRKSVGPGSVPIPGTRMSLIPGSGRGPDTRKSLLTLGSGRGPARYQEESRRVFVSAPQRTVRPWKAAARCVLLAALEGCSLSNIAWRSEELHSVTTG